MTEPILQRPPGGGVDAGVRRWLPLIVGIAVGLRLALAFVLKVEFADAADYDALARALLEGKPYEVGGNVASRMPGYPLFVAGVYAVFGYHPVAVLGVQALLGGAIVWLTYRIARGMGERTGLVAAGLVAVDPLSVGFSATLLSETPFTLVVLLTLLVARRALEEETGCWECMGILWAAAVYLRAAALGCIVPLTLALSFLGKRLKRWERIEGPIVATGLMLLLLLPWQVRNYGIFNSGFYRLTTLEGISLYEAVYPEADGGPRQGYITLPPEMRGLTEAQRNDEWSRRAWRHIASDPARMVKLGVVKFGRMWSPWLNAAEMRSRVAWWGMTVWSVPLFGLALVGIWGSRMGWREKVVLLMPVVYFSLLHSLFLGSVRYRVPLMPLVCVFAAAGLTSLWPRVNLGGQAQRSAEPEV